MVVCILLRVAILSCDLLLFGVEDVGPPVTCGLSSVCACGNPGFSLLVQVPYLDMVWKPEERWIHGRPHDSDHRGLGEIDVPRLQRGKLFGFSQPFIVVPPRETHALVVVPPVPQKRSKVYPLLFDGYVRDCHSISLNACQKQKRSQNMMKSLE